MILQALTSYYEELVKKGKISGPGWGEAKVSYELVINEDGELTDVVSVKIIVEKGKTKNYVPRNMKVPAPIKRSSGIASNFLCDHSGYLLGIDSKNNPTRARDCFNACKQKHYDILKDTDEPAARAVLRFFDKWDPEFAKNHPALSEDYEEIISGVNLVFRYKGQELQDNPIIGKLWENYYLALDNGKSRTTFFSA